VRQPDGWIVWLATRDYRYGTYLRLLNNGKVYRVIVRENEGDEIILVRPADLHTCDEED
jgi:hypothetical protein